MIGLIVLRYFLGMPQIVSQGQPKTPGGGGTPIYGLYRYVPRNRVWFFRFSVLK